MKLKSGIIALTTLRDRYLTAAKKLDEAIMAIGVDFNETGRFYGISQTEGCYQILEESARPMNKTEIYKVFVENGGRIPSPHHLAPVLSRDQRITSNQKGQWAIKQNEN